MKTVDVVIPTRRREHAFTCLSQLRFIPWPIRLHLITEEPNSWSRAVNVGLAESKNDVILMDDDVFLRPETFSAVDQFYDRGDIFGFKLLYPDGTIQHGGGIARNGSVNHIALGEEDKGQCDNAMYTCHLTTSLVYIKRHVLDKLGGMATDYPGLQFEDVDFSFRALEAGFNLLYLPQSAIHVQTASKRSLPRFKERVEENYNLLKARWLDRPEWRTVIEKYPKPLNQLEVVSA